MKISKLLSALSLVTGLVFLVPIAHAAQDTEKGYKSFALTSQQYQNIARQVIRMRGLSSLILQQTEAKLQYQRLSKQDFLRYVHGLAFDRAFDRPSKSFEIAAKKNSKIKKTI